MKTFKILTIDGGGIKGLYSSTILEHFEEKFECSISDHFDMICGTSTGGLIALALSLKIPASEISKIYSEHGSKIFPKQYGLGLLKQIFFGGKFSDKQLKEVLIEVFGSKTISDSNNLLCIPTYSLTDGKPWVIKYDHKEHKLSRDNKTKYVDAALATSAAPTYFPLAELNVYNNKQFIDGGVWANNPTLVGLIEALAYFAGKDKEYDRVAIMSISSLSHTGGKKLGLRRRRAFIQWRNALFETALNGQSFFSNHFMEKVNEIGDVPIEYLRIPTAEISSEQESLVQLDVASKKAIDFITGKGNDMGVLYTKMPQVKRFFEEQKTYII
ncbi:CBASS cGAMP-activated phospholipase [Roseivirga pacifica]